MVLRSTATGRHHSSVSIVYPSSVKVVNIVAGRLVFSKDDVTFDIDLPFDSDSQLPFK